MTFLPPYYNIENKQTITEGGYKMLKYKFNVGDALYRAGFTSYKAKTSGMLSQDTLKKIKNEDTNISLKAINSLCMILDMQPKDLLIYEETDTEKEQKEKL